MKKNTRVDSKQRFRISAKRIYLTYSQVDTRITSEILLEILKNKKPFVFHYLIAKEYHQDGGIHFHVLLESSNKFNIKDAGFLDIQYQENNYHGNYQPVKSFANVVQYVCKAGDVITDLTNIRNGELMTTKEILIERALEIGVSNALIEHCKNLPNKALPNLSLTSAKTFFENLHKLQQISEADDVETPFRLKDFNLKDNQELQRWIEDPAKTLVLAGPSGVGKTQFCKAFAQDKALKALIVNHAEDFNRLNAEHECIIVDDANMHQIDSTQLLAVIDNAVHKTLRVLYNTVKKKPGIIQMLTMNKEEFKKIENLLKQERFARRLVFSQIKSNIINLNVNIQINNTTNNFAQHKMEEQTFIDANRRRMLEFSNS